MKKLGMLLAAGLLLASAAATAQTPMRIRGTITSLDGDVLSVKTRDGKDVKVNLAPNYGVAPMSARPRRRTLPASWWRARSTGCLPRRRRATPPGTAPRETP